MRRLGPYLFVSAFTVAPALAQQGGLEEADRRLDRLAERSGQQADDDDDDDILTPSLQTSGLEEDDDLLNPDLGGASPAAPAMPGSKVTPPLAEKTRLDNDSAALGQAADAYGDELEALARTLRESRSQGETQLREKLAEAEARSKNMHSELVALEGKLDEQARAERRRARERGGYGTPLDARRLRSNGSRFSPAASQGGDGMYRWWQGLLRKLLTGAHPGLKKLAEHRANELKARADALALSAEKGHRPYADWAVRENVGSSRFASASMGRQDRRLNDLLLPGNAKPTQPSTVAQQQPIARQQDDPPARVVGRGGPVVLLPRRRNPVTGRMQVIVNMPLGGPFSPGSTDPQPTQGAGSERTPVDPIR